MLRPPPEPFTTPMAWIPAGLYLLKLDLKAAGLHVLGGPAGSGGLFAYFAGYADEVFPQFHKLVSVDLAEDGVGGSVFRHG